MAGPRKRSALIALLVSDQQGGSQAAILEELRRCLLDGGVPPGTAIPLDEVAQVFGVSRIPVREALKTLIGEGLVEHQLNFGYRVAKLTTRELHELYVVREVLEVAALTAAVAKATQQDDIEATATHEALGQAIKAHDVRGYHRDSRRFHLALVRPCGMHRLLAMLESAWNTTEPVQPMAHLSDGVKAVMHHDHAEMLAAFLARDEERLVAAARAHHDRLRASLAALPRHTGLFVDTD
ncbi:GntR family transcriptional regulator [Lentzea aerocolonigenes]|uniref:GntR family transcriptional regulator n=1 Tax=Lentzea aerocolonigenes TaxID=68170 RepID=A0A0F0GYD2_LENAE|nr:GntR family transcriptional regulator [Lentzea aerocolonigenes]KJK48464.1 GntR family transcriptional regulator [Lentzea aerocolonigenes]